MQYRTGDRVMYQDDAGSSQQTGQIKRVMGSGQETSYTISNEDTGQNEEVMHEQIKMRVQ